MEKRRCARIHLHQKLHNQLTLWYIKNNNNNKLNNLFSHSSASTDTFITSMMIGTYIPDFTMFH